MNRPANVLLSPRNTTRRPSANGSAAAAAPAAARAARRASRMGPVPFGLAGGSGAPRTARALNHALGLGVGLVPGDPPVARRERLQSHGRVVFECPLVARGRQLGQ